MDQTWVNSINKKNLSGKERQIPAYSYCHGLRRGSTGTDDLRLQAVRLKQIQEGIAGRDRPWTKGKKIHLFFFISFFIFYFIHENNKKSITLSKSAVSKVNQLLNAERRNKSYNICSLLKTTSNKQQLKLNSKLNKRRASHSTHKG